MDTIFDQVQGAGGILPGHFVYKSGLHGPQYIDIDPIFADPPLLGQFARALAEQFDFEFEVVVGPAIGGAILATVISQLLATLKPAGLWADKTDSGFAIERLGFARALRGKQVLVVEDLLTTGSSVAAVCRQVEQCGGYLMGVSAIWNRGGVTAEQLGVSELRSLCEIVLPAFPPDACPLCRQRQPIIENIAHGARWKAQYPDYPGGYRMYPLP